MYSNQREVSLWLDDEHIATLAGRRVFRFQVPLTGEHRLTARSGDLEDTITVRRVDEACPGYALAAAPISNWFDAIELTR